jgi:hypothetical protein
MRELNNNETREDFRGRFEFAVIAVPLTMNPVLPMNLHTPHPNPLPVEGRGRRIGVRAVQGFNAQNVFGKFSPCPVASQARHEIVSPKELCASRNVVPKERVMRRPFAGKNEIFSTWQDGF